MAGLGVPALVGALLILLATGLPAVFAGPAAGPIGRPSMTPAARAGPAVRVGPFPRHRYAPMMPAKMSVHPATSPQERDGPRPHGPAAGPRGPARRS
jgi:hypothetical protein